ncbi:MAG: hypothetical protein Kow0089_10970 [Desulfobulbaceae bacterium]
MSDQRKVAVVTSLGKTYRGLVDVPNADFRTTDLFNSANIYWKNPNEKCFENAVLFTDVQLLVGDSTISVRFDRLQIRLSEVIYFYDDRETITDDKEKKRASSMIQKTKEEAQSVDIITAMVANSFYHLTGTFFGLFRKKSNDKFIPLTDVKMIEIYRKGDRWFQRKVDLPHRFIGVGTAHIEALRLR